MTTKEKIMKEALNMFAAKDYDAVPKEKPAHQVLWLDLQAVLLMAIRLWKISV